MVLYRITDRLDFMGKLLTGDCFDSFLLGEAIIHTNNSYVIDGHVNKEFYSTEELQDTTLVPYEYSEWKQMRPICYQLIKGKRTPVSFQFILYLKPEATEKLLEGINFPQSDTSVKHMVLNIKFDQSGLSLTTAIAYSAFTMDKQVDVLWDKTLSRFLSKKEIAYEEA